MKALSGILGAIFLLLVLAAVGAALMPGLDADWRVPAGCAGFFGVASAIAHSTARKADS